MRSGQNEAGTIQRITAETTIELAQVGGKVGGLVRLLAGGLEVPEAWVIPATVSLDAARRAEVIDVALESWWLDATAQFPDALWAVRSSAVAEDLDGASFAGVYETVLSLSTLDRVKKAVLACWAAVASERATTYLGGQSLDASGGIALILQRMVRPRIAGVLLTENPLRPFADQIVIDAAYGLGEGVVSGFTDPDHVVLDRATGTIVAERIGGKNIEVGWGPLGSVQRPVSDALRAIRCLSGTDLAALHALAARIGEIIGERRDVEWAIEEDRLYALQDRAITNLPPRRPHVVWSRRFGDEYLAEYITPLGDALMNPWLTGPQMDEVLELQGRGHLVGSPKLRLHDGYAYINGAYVLELAKAVPQGSREGPLTDWFDGQWAEKIRTCRFEPALLIATLRAPNRDAGRGPAKDNLLALERHCAVIDAEIAPKLDQDYRSLSDAQWRAQLAEVEQLGRDHFRVIRWGMAHHLPIRMNALETLLGDWAKVDGEEVLQRLMAGLPGIWTAQINREVFQLGVAARDDRELLAALRSDESYEAVRARTAAAPFWMAFDSFLAQHGHRCATREISAPRWRESPESVLGLVRAHVRCEEVGASPALFEERALRQRLELERELFTTVSRGPLGFLRHRTLRWLVRSVQEFTVYRENQRYHLDYLLCHMHLLCLELGRRLVARGILIEQSDVFLLDSAWFRASVRGDVTGPDAVLTEHVERARTHRERYQNRLPPTFLFDDVATEGDAVVEIDVRTDGALAGIAASAGLGIGPVRVVASLADLAHVRPGDVLVASNIDPGWTSVFPMIAGLVTETGGVLSHGAILAREYGIATVTGVVDAVKSLPAGGTVTVDGIRGLVIPAASIR